jgi:hypothetical protein
MINDIILDKFNKLNDEIRQTFQVGQFQTLIDYRDYAWEITSEYHEYVNFYKNNEQFDFYRCFSYTEYGDYNIIEATTHGNTIAVKIIVKKDNMIKK